VHLKGAEEMNQNVFCKNCHRIPDQCRCNNAPRELSDDEINEIAQQCWVYPQGEQAIFNQHKFARAILKKASEK
jgi:hypothetical protein